MKKSFLVLIVINIIIITIISYFLFSAIEFSKKDVQYKYTVGAVYGDLDNSYYYTLHDKISNVLIENDCLVVNRDCKNDIELQNQQIRDLVNMGVDALLITPVDSTKIESSLLFAKDRGIPIVILDNPVYRDDLVSCTIHSDNFRAGSMQGVYLKNNVTNPNIILLSDNRDISAKNRILGFEKIIKSFPEAKIIQEIDTIGSNEKSMEAIEKLIENKTKFNVIFSVNDICALGAYAALKKHNIEDVKILSIDGSPKGKLMVMNNHFFSTVLQYPDILGDKSAKAILSLLAGDIVKKDTIVPVKLITNNTIRSYDLEKWE